MGERLCGIDPSGKRTGVALFVGGEYVGSGVIDRSRVRDTEARFAEMARAVWECLDRAAPDAVCVEETAVTRNAQTQRYLSRLQGVIYAWCMRAGCAFRAVRPTAWRAALGFAQGRNVHRDELKEQAMRYAYERHGVRAGDDEADAICIGDAALARGWWQGAGGKEREERDA